VQAKRLVALAAGVAALTAGAHLANANQYEIRPGDTLSEIARRLDVSVQDLADANGIDDPDFIVAGRLLVVPSDAGSATEYIVQRGETLSDIAEKVGVPVTQLAAANNLSDPNLVPAGRLLSVPPVGSVVTKPADTATGAATVPSSGRYTVRPGDALSDIAVRLGVPLGQLAAANGIRDPNLITEGQVIAVPNSWDCPVPGATFANDWGYVRPDGARHNGIDMFAPKGTAIFAPVGGTVERYPNPSGGLAVELYGRDGNRYYFAHLDDYGDGGTVSGGDIIGYVGNTGEARYTSSHLHFEIHPGGGETTINPFPSLVAACR
jgi:murein DD-endopeptidase MepM/ murein hydrolase activator NlpD